ncbi:GSCOCG00008850001-RA-CDS [Cotesia congregata]|uniref:ras-related protein Rab-18-B-like n=1 Tax=Cotesia glomerata TaxID=32391 RepID=UPI0017550FDA|nr:ras-related protein Rab-18-B-like [Cotesia glomerata]CAD6240569.1 GSCOCG00008850001-RA-CDS [Cotesia congregata]
MTMDQEVLTTLKLLMIGESNVGKSSILLRFTEDEFNENIQNTVGMDYKTKQVNIDGNVVKLAIWDTAGQERFRTLTPSYYRDGQGAILMYDVTDRNTFVKLETWLDELNTYCNKSEIVKMVVGNKIDLPDRQVTTEEGLNFARRHQTLYIESSAKTADGVKCCFEELVQKILQTPGLWEHNNSSRIQNIAGGGPRQRLGKRGMLLTDDPQPQDAYNNCYC